MPSTTFRIADSRRGARCRAIALAAPCAALLLSGPAIGATTVVERSDDARPTLAARPAVHRGLDGCDARAAIDAGDLDARLDAACLMRAVVARYRAMRWYVDASKVVQSTTDREGAVRRIERRLDVRVRGRDLDVQTSGSRLGGLVRRGLGLEGEDGAAAAVDDRLGLWLAPHLALRYADGGRAERSGVDGGLVPTAARVDAGRLGPRLRLELEGDGGDATFVLFIDPTSLLVRRVDGRQRLPGGALYETTVEVLRASADDADASAADAPVDDPGWSAPDDDAPPASRDPLRSAPPADADPPREDAPPAGVDDDDPAAPPRTLPPGGPGDRARGDGGDERRKDGDASSNGDGTTPPPARGPGRDAGGTTPPATDPPPAREDAPPTGEDDDPPAATGGGTPPPMLAGGRR